jgi:phosphoribosylformylglycinamidine cyclo-ligase
VSYRDAGVDVDAAAAAVERIKTRVAATFGGEAAPIGHFGGIYRLPAGPDRLLVASADGIGTKIKLAFVLGGEAHARVAGDLVNHCVNDILALGARPLFFLDYVAMGRLDPDALDGLIAGMAEACAANGLALIGGETAEMPGLYAEGEYDVAGFIVGEVAPGAVIDGSAVREGDVLVGLPSDGLHTNGYSLARRLVGLTGNRAIDLTTLAAPLPGGGGETIGEALMRPHRAYVPAVWPLLERTLVRGMAHITGGGLLDNVPRMLPAGHVAEIDPTTWETPPVFAYLTAAGDLPAEERYRAFNMGIGYVLAVAPEHETEVRAALPDALTIGRVRRGSTTGQGDDDRPLVRGLTDGDRTDV